MNETTSHNLGLSIDRRTRSKFVRAAKDRLDLFARVLGDRGETIRAINEDRPIDRIRAIGYEGDGAAMDVPADVLASDGGEHDESWFKALHDVDVCTRRLERALLRLESVATSE